MFHKQHYKEVARIIRESKTRVLGTNYTLIEKEALVNGLVELFRRDNPLFDEILFRKEIDK